MRAYCVALSIRSNDFRTRSHQRKLMDATDIAPEVSRKLDVGKKYRARMETKGDHT